MLEWSPDESKILYIAEERAQPTEPFYARQPCAQTDGQNNTVKSKVYF